MIPEQMGGCDRDTRCVLGNMGFVAVVDVGSQRDVWLRQSRAGPKRIKR